MTSTIYDIDLDRNPANFQPLTPLSFLERAAAVHRDRTAIVHGARSFTYAQFYARARQLAQGASPMVELSRDKPTVIALRELAASKYGVEILNKSPT